MFRFLILSLSFFISCSSPADVDAERTQENIKNQDPKALLLIADKEIIDFGQVYISEENERTLKLTNVTGENYIINDITFKNQPSIFYLRNKNYPLILEPYQSFSLTVYSRQNVSGLIEDELIIDSERSPVVGLKSLVPDFQLSNDEIIELKKGDIGNVIVSAINNSNRQLDLIRIYLSADNSNLFSLGFNSKDYQKIKPKETFLLPVEFEAKFVGEYSVIISIDVEGEGIFIENSIIKINVTD
ncbi:hypothetical protein OAQ99_07345 [Candidatus Kapabacteria bacterium]|nr:hypothetical protein [Candidatus Kapabacteria bacterium]